MESRVKAALLREPGRPLEITEVALSEPAPREVVIRTAAAGVCRSDLHFADGAWPHPMPTVLGHEAAGVVEAVGSAVINVKPGDHVITFFTVFCGTCEFCVSGRPSLCVDPGETPLQAARRELAEETGLRARKMKKLAEMWASPGFLAERMTIYLATELTQGESEPMEDERLEPRWFGVRELDKMIEAGKITDAKTVIGFLKWHRYVLGK